MGYIFKRKRPDGKTSKYWYAELDGKIFSLRLTERSAAQSRLVELMKEKELEKTGMIAPRTVREAFKIPLSEHLRDFLSNKIIEGRSKKRVHCLKLFLEKIFTDCNWKHLEDLNSSEYLKWRAQQVLKSAKTHNEYLGALTTFCNSLLKHGKIHVNPFSVVNRIDTRGQKTFYRRALTDEEQKRLLSVKNLERRTMYYLGIGVGLRHGEIEKLDWTDFNLDIPKPTVILRASITKNKKRAILPLSFDVVQALKEYRQDKTSGLLFLKKIRFERQMRQDWKEAGISVYDEYGKKADFHALRVTFCTNLQKSGVSFQLAQILMRHSDYRLTSEIYTDAGAFDLHAAVNSIPRFVPEKCIVKCIVHAGVEGGEKECINSILKKENPLNLPQIVSKTLKTEDNKMVAGVGIEPTAFRL